MESKYKLLLFVLPFLVQVQGKEKYYLTDTAVTSENAFTSCTLATPEILFSHLDDSVELFQNEIQGASQDVQFESSFWIGYAEIYTAFLYIGCAQVSHVTDIKHEILKRDPGQCYSFCGTKFVGVQDTTCRCISTLPAKNKLWSSGCTLKCSYPLETLCGSKNSVSIYKKVQHTVTSTGDSNNTIDLCRAFDSKSNDYFWKTCTAKYKQICQKAPYNDLNAQFAPSLAEGDWQSSMQSCLSHKQYPAIEQPNHMPDGRLNGLYWVGLLRSFSLTPTTGTSRYTPGVQQGYIQYRDGTFWLKFTQQKETRKAICVKENEATSPSHGGSTTTKTPSSSSPLPSTSSALSTSSAPMSTGRSSTQTSHIPSSVSTSTYISTSDPSQEGPSSLAPEGEDSTATVDGQSKENSSNDLIYVVIPIILVLVAVVVLLIVWRIRNVTKKKNTQLSVYPGPSKDERTNGSTSTTQVSNRACSANFEPSGDREHDCFVLEPTKDYASIQETKVPNSNDDTYDSTIVTKGMTQLVFNEHANVYNTLKGVMDDTYHHIGKSANKPCDTGDYDTTDITNPENSFDTYNHIGGLVAGNAIPTRGMLNPSEGLYDTAGAIDDTYDSTIVAKKRTVLIHTTTLVD